MDEILNISLCRDGHELIIESTNTNEIDCFSKWLKKVFIESPISEKFYLMKISSGGFVLFCQIGGGYKPWRSYFDDIQANMVSFSSKVREPRQTVSIGKYFLYKTLNKALSSGWKPWETQEEHWKRGGSERLYLTYRFSRSLKPPRP